MADLVPGIEPHRVQQSLLRPQGSVGLIIEAAELGMAGGQRGIELNGAFQRQNRGVRIARAAQRETERQPAERQLRIEGQRAIGRGQRRLGTVELQQRRGDAEMAGRAGLVADDGLAIDLDRLREPPQLGERAGEGKMRLNVFGRDRDGGLPGCHGAGGVADHQQRLRQRDPGAGVAGIEPDIAPVGLRRRAMHAHLRADGGEREPGSGMSRAHGDHALERGGRLAKLLEFDPHQTEQIERGRLARLGAERLDEARLRVPPTTCLVLFETGFQAFPADGVHSGRHRSPATR